jgi:4-amino-4-deoxy-L-arabinose transferase-like glycosyltransferase
MSRRRTRSSSAAGPAPASPARSTDSPPWPLLLTGIGALALTLRLIHIRALAAEPVFGVLLGDARRYVEWAREIAAGNWIGTGAFYQAPLYPYAVAALFSLSGESLDAIRVAQALAGAAACVLVAVAGHAFFEWRVGVLAGLALALYPPAIFFDGHIQKSSLDLLLMAAMLATVANYQIDGRTRWLVALGVALGLFTLNRENARALFPLLAAWLLLWRRDLTIAPRARLVGVFTLATLLPIAPVALRNYFVSGELLISTSQLGSNFYIGNHAGASGVYEPLLPDRGTVEYEQQDAMRLASEAAGRPLSAGEVSDYWLGRALDEIRRDVGGWMRLMARKALLAVNTVEAADTESLAFHADHSRLLRVLTPLTFGLWLSIAVVGIALTAREWRRLAVLYGIGLVFLMSIVVFFVLARYRHPVVAVVMLFAAAGIVGAAGAWRERPRQLSIAIVCALAIALVVNRPMQMTSDESYGNFGGELLRLERPREALPLLVKAVELLPNEPAVRRDLALAHVHLGDHAAAAREYAAVARLERKPDSTRKIVEVLVRMATQDATEGRIDQAVVVLQEASLLARFNGQLADASDIDLTIDRLLRRARTRF